MGSESQKKGKRGEYYVMGKMLDLGLDIYVPVVDVESIDCIIRTSAGTYKAVQIKTRSHKKKGEIFEIVLPTSTDNFFVIIHIAGSKDVWVLPYNVFLITESNLNISRSKGRFDWFLVRKKRRFHLVITIDSIYYKSESKFQKVPILLILFYLLLFAEASFCTPTANSPLVSSGTF